MKLYRVIIPEADFAALPPEDRNALLLYGHVLNEINIIRKATVVAISSIDQSDPAFVRAGIGQAMTFMRLLGGKTFEGWEVFRKHFFGNGVLAKKYAPRLEHRCGKILADLKHKFSTDNFLAKLRNSHVFHYPGMGEIDAGYRALTAPDGWDFYLSDIEANTFYYPADLVAGAAMFQATKEPDLRAMSDKFGEEVTNVAAQVEHLLSAVVEEIMVEHFEKQVKGAEEVARGATLPRLEDLSMRFHVANELPE